MKRPRLLSQFSWRLSIASISGLSLHKGNKDDEKTSLTVRPPPAPTRLEETPSVGTSNSQTTRNDSPYGWIGDVLKVMDNFDDLTLITPPEELPIPVPTPPEVYINTLPDEVLALIFEWGAILSHQAWPLKAPSDKDWVPIRRCFPECVSQVNHYWRDLALSTPPLWSYMSIRLRYGKETAIAAKKTKWIDTYFSRSINQPLDLIIDTRLSWLYQWPHWTMSKFTPHANRWRSLSIILPNNTVLKGITGVLSTISVPKLETFEVRYITSIKVASAPHVVPLFSDGDGAPALAHIVLGRVGLSWSSVSFQALSSLELHHTTWPDYNQLRDIVSCCCLSRLVVHADPTDFEKEVNQKDNDPIVLPTLRHLEVAGALTTQLFNLFETPALTHLVLIKPAVKALHSICNIPQLRELRGLTITETQNIREDTVLLLTRSFPLLSELSLYLLSASPFIRLLSGVSALSTPDELPWPHLDTLKIQGWFLYSSIIMIRALVFSRMNKGTRFKLVSLDESFFRDADKTRRLEELVIVDQLAKWENCDCSTKTGL
ncbi:hypothetical protein BDN72DRAFT_894069 [Pluteus cervinus]|uniref:Uncharacterized protein n=1 Tax=Pluteus cervinus TaxID=181527 RepID=A0ACD3B531_9AGAR|nr:hypothetical protein BDN72DRAFT_894069 [Pluteus cervinus]